MIQSGRYPASCHSENRVSEMTPLLSCDMPALHAVTHWVQCWAPHSKREVDRLEKVQWRVIQLIRGLGSRTDEDRMKELG